MKRALVVYESMFGNTRDVGAAIAEGLAARGAGVELVDAESAPGELADGFDLLVVGTPTHAFGLPRRQTRAEAAGRVANGEPISRGDGVREWVERVRVVSGQPTATFDTKVDRPRLPGSAARAVARRLRDRGATIIDTQTFRVTGVEGPLMEGELVRARAWAGALVVDAAIHRVG